jgi:hypothetical protein
MSRRLAILFLAACNGDSGLPDEGPPPTLSGPLLAFDSTQTASTNSDNLPDGFTSPQPTVCGPDPTRGFLTELIEHGVTDPNVPYEWAPVVPSAVADLPTIDQPEFYLSGALVRLDRSGLDFRPPHPFGFDTNLDVRADEPFLDLVDNRPGSANDGDIIHTEIESGLFPETAFGMTPTAGDRVLMKGAWILDCGHPPYESEVHPPSFVALARTDGGATVSLAFANPYRTTQLYGPPELTTKLGDDARYGFDTVGTFTDQLGAQIIKAAFAELDQFSLHALLEATSFEPVTWFVCAPQPKPAGATLDYTYRFVTRTGVTVTAATRGDSGCLRFRAEMGTKYQPAVPARMDYMWPWAQISAEATAQYGQAIDVRTAALDALVKAGFTNDIHALHADVPILIDQYAALAPRAGASSDAPTDIVTGADDQPFPFYGRARVGWSK